ncbi:MAG: anion permease, partial [Clostridia bacterium]|nr:anion permease [Clostridia bacterium]
MIATLIISALTCALMLVVVLKKPSVSIKIKNKNFSVGTYWIVALVGAITLIVARSVSLSQVWRGITADTAINPIKILALFISMTALSVFLDEMNFFAYLAAKSVSGAREQKRFFIKLYILVSVHTVFTSNDVIILTFTPFICCYAKNAGVNPVPYLVSEFVAANTFSLTFIIGNPTNIYLATFCGIGFGRYFLVMAVPALLAGLTGFVITYLIFHRQLSQPLQKTDTQVEIKDKPLLVVGLIALGSCTVLLAISSYLG